MIPYEQLCEALARFNGQQSEAPPSVADEGLDPVAEGYPDAEADEALAADVQAPEGQESGYEPDAEANYAAATEDHDFSGLAEPVLAEPVATEPVSTEMGAVEMAPQGDDPAPVDYGGMDPIEHVDADPMASVPTLPEQEVGSDEEPERS